MIDLDYFPHIADLIFDYAPYRSLFVMSHVCRAWRSRVAAQFHHLYDGDAPKGDAPVSFCFEKNGPRVAVRCKADQQVLRLCRVLDCGTPPRFYGELLRDAAVRYTARDSTPRFFTGTVRKIVAANYWGFVDREACIEKAVIVQRYDYNFRHFDDEAPAPHIVYVFAHPPEGHPAAKYRKRSVRDWDRSASDRWQTDWDRKQVWSAFWRILQAARRSDAHLTLVGVERLGLRSRHVPTGRGYIPDALAYEILDIIKGLDTPDRFKTMTIEEYRRHIGEEEFAVETGWCDGE